MTNEEHIDWMKGDVVRILTPYSVGTGFWLSNYHVILTNEHVIRDNAKVVVENSEYRRVEAEVIHQDAVHDLAILKVNEAFGEHRGFEFRKGDILQGMDVSALGFKDGRDFIMTKGVVEKTDLIRHEVRLLKHTAMLDAGCSGGPLLSNEWEIVGLNMQSVKEGVPGGIALPGHALHHLIEEVLNDKLKSLRCHGCRTLIIEESGMDSRCIHCGDFLPLLQNLPPYEPTGVRRTIEGILKELGYRVDLSRTGQQQWDIREGSANISLAYHEKSGMIIGEAYLCGIPAEKKIEFFKFLLQQNEDLRGLTFGIREKKVVLSALIYDHFLHEDTGKKMLLNLFEMADYYDDILVNQFGAPLD